MRVVVLRKLSVVALSTAVVIYPFIVYLAVGHVQPHWLAIALCLMAFARAVVTRDQLWCWVGGVTAGLVVASVYSGHSWQMLKLYPVVVNAGFLVVFAASVVDPPTVIERLARLADPLLPHDAIPYTRKVTLVWCGFFIINGALAFFTAFWASDEVWTIYNGFLSYVAMVLLFSVEWCVRQRVTRARVNRESVVDLKATPLRLKEVND